MSFVCIIIWLFISQCLIIYLILNTWVSAVVDYGLAHSLARKIKYLEIIKRADMIFMLLKTSKSYVEISINQCK